MIVSSGWLFLLLIAAALLPIGLVFQISNWAHSRFRNRLWNLRDDLVDDLLSGKIQFTPGSVRLLRLMETHIRNAKRHTFVDVLLAVKATHDVRLPSISEGILSQEMSEADRTALRRYFDEFRVINFHHLQASSPSGWLVWLALKARALLVRLLPQELDANPEIRKQVVRVELKAIPEMTPPPEKPVRRGPLLDEPVFG